MDRSRTEGETVRIPTGSDRLPYEYDRLRGQGGVHQVELPDGAMAWLVTGHAQVAAALADPRLSLDKAHASSWTGFALPPALDANLLNMDPPDHARIRALVTQAFTPRRVEALRPGVQRIAETLVDRLLDPSFDRAGADLIATFAGPLPVTVMSDLLGIDEADRENFRVWTNAMLTTYPPDRTAAAHAVGAMLRFVVTLVASRRADPGDDLLSALLAARDNDDRLSEDELTSLVFLILFAGYENSINLIANTVVMLLRRAGSGGHWGLPPAQVPAAVEEAMRLLPPAPVAIRRFPIDDVTIDGVTIPAGATVLLAIAAANRDPAVFPHAADVDLDRGANAHLSFGRGIHYCIGAPLARMEAQIAVETLMRRMPELRLAGDDLEWRTSFRTLGLVELPVLW